MISIKDVLDVSYTYGQINRHITTLYFLVTQTSGPIVELGVQNCNSTIALLFAAQKYNRSLFSIDLELSNRIKDLSEEPNWYFLLGDDREIVKRWEHKIGFIFYDSEQTKEHVRFSLEHWTPFLLKSGIMAFHDTFELSGNPNPNLLEPLKEFVKENDDKFSFINYEQGSGLGILFRKGN